MRLFSGLRVNRTCLKNCTRLFMTFSFMSDSTGEIHHRTFAVRVIGFGANATGDFGDPKPKVRLMVKHDVFIK